MVNPSSLSTFHLAIPAQLTSNTTNNGGIHVEPLSENLLDKIQQIFYF